MPSTILDDFSVWSSECPSDEEIGLSDCFDDSPELAVLEQPTGTLINSGGTDPRALRSVGSSTCGAANSVFASSTPGRSAGGASGSSTGGTRSRRTNDATANMASKEDPTPQDPERAATVKKQVHGWKLTRPAKSRAEIWTRGWFKITAATDHAICTLCVQEEAWESCEVSYGKFKTATNLVNHFNCEGEDRLRAMMKSQVNGSILTF